MNKETFIKECKKLGINLSDKQLNQLEKYYEFLILYNQKVNLTRITNKEDVYLKHFYDSLTIIKYIDIDNKNICDVGTGAGFPGMILKIIKPSIKLTLVDALNKRITFLKELANILELKDIEFYHARFEEFARNNIEKYDVVTARAVSNISFLAETTVQMLKIKAKLVLMRGHNDYDDNERTKMLKELNLNLISKNEFILPKENSLRTIIILEKNAKTSLKYPRRIETIKKNPL